MVGSIKKKNSNIKNDNLSIEPLESDAVYSYFEKSSRKNRLPQPNLQSSLTPKNT